MNVEKHSPGSIGVVRNVYPSPCQIPYEPAIHSAEKYLPLFRTLPHALNIFKYPLYLCGGEIRVNKKSRLVLEKLLQALTFHSCAVLRSPSALPNDSVVNRLAGVPVPKYRRFTLIGDADSRHVLRCYPCLCNDLTSRTELTFQYVHRVMLHPAVAGEYLRIFFLYARNLFTLCVKKHRSGGSRSLI